MVFWAHPNPQTKLQLNRFSRFAGLAILTDRSTDRQIDRQTTLLGL